MFTRKLLLKAFLTLTALTALTSLATYADNTVLVTDTLSTKKKAVTLNVYKSLTCSCCKKWISHLDDNGFQSKVYNTDNISLIKDNKGIESRYRSCHTAISTQGYIFEGHVPAKFIDQFFKETHANDVLGLSVPGMYVGSPGMEVDDKFQPYQVLLLKADGSHEIYARLQSYKEQF